MQHPRALRPAPPPRSTGRTPLALACLAVLFASPSPATEVRAGNGTAVDPALRELLLDAVEDANSFRDRFDAEVWLVDMSRRLQRRLPDPARRLELLTLVHAEATRAALSPNLVLAVIDVESNFDRWAISSAGARGLMQIMPFWLDEIGRPEDNLFKVQTNLRYGCTILRYYLDMENGNLRRALARYNGSLGRTTYVNRVLTRLHERWYRL